MKYAWTAGECVYRKSVPDLFVGGRKASKYLFILFKYISTAREGHYQVGR